MTWEECLVKYEPLCHRFAKQYSGLHTTTYDERVNLALYGLWIAFNEYDENKGASFLSFAFLQIKSRFSSEVKKSKRLKNNYLFLDKYLSSSLKIHPQYFCMYKPSFLASFCPSLKPGLKSLYKNLTPYFFSIISPVFLSIS